MSCALHAAQEGELVQERRGLLKMTGTHTATQTGRAHARECGARGAHAATSAGPVDSGDADVKGPGAGKAAQLPRRPGHVGHGDPGRGALRS